MPIQQTTDWLRRLHYRVDPEARVIDCFRVEVMDMHLYAGSYNRPNVQLKQLWEEALYSARFLQNSFAQRDWRQFGLKGPDDFRPFAYIIGCQEERVMVEHEINMDMMCYESMFSRTQPPVSVDPGDHERRVRHLIDAWDGLEWLAMN